jgi:hypothetical protein
MAARGQGDYSIDDMQRALNLWIPRGLEMFGNERGGETAVTFGFKDKTNGTAQGEYIEEVRGVVRNTNIAMLQERITSISRPDAHEILDEIERSGDPKRGIKPEEILHMPDPKFFRKRGLDEFMFQPFDVKGQLLTEGGKPLSHEGYLSYLVSVLPQSFIGSREYNKYVEQRREFFEGKQ